MCEAEGICCALGEVADTNPETLAGNTPQNARFRYIDLSAVELGFIKWSAVAETTFGSAPSRARRIVKASDVLFGTVRPNLKSHGLIGPDEEGPFVASTGFSVVRARDGLSHPSYLFHSLMSNHVTAQAIRDAIGSSYPAVNDSDVKRFQIFFPPYREQQKIAHILDTLDTAIHETEAIIAKLKAVKQGLLHDLLTRGIDDNGELRPPQSEAPHLYKPSPLGWIPKEWDTHVFGDIIEHVIDFRGRTPKKLGMDWGGGDILALSANNVQPGAIDISREAYFGSELLYRKWMTSGDVRKGDVLLTMEAPLGNVAQIPDDARYILSQRVIALRFNARVILNDFAFWQMQCHEFQSAMASRSTGSTATGIQRAELVKLHFKAPAIWEQSLIVERLASIEHKLQSERLALAKRIQQKAGLMDDLLTGRVRVTPLLQEAQRA
jgi:type I restriction enzyme S subunit